MLFTQLFAIACVLFSVKVESLTPDKKYCGLQQVGFLKPAFYACIIFDYDSTMYSGYDEVSVKRDGEISLKRQGFTENDHPFPNVELGFRLVGDAENDDTMNMVDADREILYTLTTEQCQRAASLRTNCQTKPVNSSRALQGVDNSSPVPAGEYDHSFRPTHDVRLTADYEVRRLGQYVVSGKSSTPFEYKSGATRLELDKLPLGFTLDATSFYLTQSRPLFKFDVTFFYDAELDKLFVSYVDNPTGTTFLDELFRS
ncbi:hypothetical protein FOZ63_016881 [Perkinsus olseni]|uniref:Uncharacterized protein n=1 Tax=Perkinsus olseni TaxID=32597 RepID=A0A7J6U9X7_PEROL|nr:hypothetical protein FOZ60_001185 [Perkinsus olseni]KAF4727974.1 hypothetical protein FOZ62_001295 [Perkinsus olseni]KAF4754122.1 hypothetical protein FOZ63_016881 [Perkinsus olseni]